MNFLYENIEIVKVIQRLACPKRGFGWAILVWQGVNPYVAWEKFEVNLSLVNLNIINYK